MGGPRLTPEQLAEGTRIAVKTGNTTEAARQIGCTEGALRHAMRRHKITRDSALHARACAAAERKGRRALADNIARLETLLVRWIDAPLGLDRGRQMTAGVIGDGPTATTHAEPKDIAALSNALANAVGAVRDVRERIDRRKQSAATLAKTKAETARALVDADLARARLAGTLPAERLEVTDEHARRARIAELLARRAAAVDSAGGGGAPGAAGGGGAGG